MKLEDIKGTYKYVTRLKEQQMKQDNMNVNIPKSAQRDLAKAKMEQAAAALKHRIDEIKQMEKSSGTPLSSEKLLGYMADIEKDFLATKIFNKLQTVLKEIEEKLAAYDAPINTMKKQIVKLTQNHDDFLITVKVSTKVVKVVGWIMGTLVTLFTLLNLIMRITGQ